MSKLVLLAINSKYVHSALPVWLLAEGVLRYAQKSHDVEIIEATIHQPDREIVEMVTAHKPDVVGISTYIWNAGKLPGLLSLLRDELPHKVIVLGGPEASYNAEYWLAQGADYVVHGEGERQLPILLDALEAGMISFDTNAKSAQTLDMRGFYKTEAGERRGVFSKTDDTNAEPVDPYNETYISTLNKRLAYLETSRGCPFQCAFCLSGGSGVRFFPLEMAKEQLYKLSRSGAKTIKLIDRTFNCNPLRAYELFEYVIGLETNCCFHFEVAADLFDKHTLKLLSAAPPGRIQFEAGLQSYHEPTLKAVSRKTDSDKADENIRTLVAGGNIHVHVDLIAGLPYETLPSFKDGFDRAYTLGAHDLQLGFLKLLHGSALREQANALGIQFQAAAPYEIISNPWLSPEDICTLKQAENALRHTHNKSRFLSTLKYVLSVSGLRPFALFHMLGEIVQSHGLSLEIYAEKIFECFRLLPGADKNELLTCMICDWLAMVRGKNMPSFMRTPDSKRKQAITIAEKKLGRAIGREEVAVLPSGESVFVDVESRDPVTGLYKLHRL